MGEKRAKDHMCIDQNELQITQKVNFMLNLTSLSRSSKYSSYILLSASTNAKS